MNCSGFIDGKEAKTVFKKQWAKTQISSSFLVRISTMFTSMASVWFPGTLRPICKPRLHQRDCYNGHKRVHGLKFQAVSLPNGLIANLYGPVEGRRHDAFMLAESGLLSKLEEKNQGEETPLCIYGDPAYPLSPELMSPYKGHALTQEQQDFNKK